MGRLQRPERFLPRRINVLAQRILEITLSVNDVEENILEDMQKHIQCFKAKIDPHTTRFPPSLNVADSKAFNVEPYFSWISGMVSFPSEDSSANNKIDYRHKF